MMDEGYGALAAALAKAQAAFPPIPREKTVTVQTRQKPDGTGGGSYTFKYAPLDSILNATRKPLTDNGLSVMQLLDDDMLVTSLLHSSGAMISGRTPIPATEGVQAFGSAITYLRRYAIQALLGIAAEEDDDGNAAAGNRATFGGKHKAEESMTADDGSLIGTAQIGKPPSDFELRQTPQGHMVSFRLADGRRSIKVVAYDGLATALAVVKDDVVGARVQCWGVVSDESFIPPGTTKKVVYQVLTLHRISTPSIILPAPEAESVPMFSEEEEAALTAAIGRV